MNIIDRFKVEHRNLAMVLKCLEQQLDALDNEQELSYPLMLCVMHYVITYPDHVHHPNEEIVFAHLREINPDSEEEIFSLSREHRHLAATSKELEQLIDAAMNGHIIRRSLLVECGRRFLKLQYEHMSAEENELFPVATRVFSEADWQTVGRLVNEREDPVFTSTPHEDLALLHQTIMQMNQETVSDDI